MSNAVSTQALNYLQRVGVTAGRGESLESLTAGDPGRRRLLRVLGIGRLGKAEDGRPTEREERIPSEQLLTGLGQHRIPLAFLVESAGTEASVQLGTWWPTGDHGYSPDRLDANERVLRSLARGIYLTSDDELASARPEQPGALLGAMVTGIPTARRRPSDPRELPLDRVLRIAGGARWRILVLAVPASERLLTTQRQRLINELRLVARDSKAIQAPSPLGDHITELLKLGLEELTRAQAVGGWRTAIYLLGDSDGYYRLSSAWRSVFAGQDSVLDPVQLHLHEDVPRLASDWAMPDIPGPPGPSEYRHPFLSQTLLSSSELARYLHLPELETSGYRVTGFARFDAAPPADRGAMLPLGHVVQDRSTTTTSYAVPLESLASHVFVAGVTGAGKTNTVFHLLRRLPPEIPFLVIEPAKTEYRALLADPEVADLRVFTAGDEAVAPLRLNPFEIQPGASLGVHLDLLRSVFASSFGDMWAPLPQVLEQCLVKIYEDRGWDIASGHNHRLGPDGWDPQAFPTLTELSANVEEVVPTLGFDPEATARILASLTSRINGLRAAGKGRMLDVPESWPIDDLLGRPTVLELDAMGDDDDKAFVIGILLVQLVEFRRLHGLGALRHILVIEEAHRLLTNVARSQNQEQSDPRGKAVETFTSLLSEIRAYGQGVVIADQVPARLAPDVIKNTNLKIAHRIVARDDRELMGGAMAMSTRQTEALSSLPRGQAAIFAGETDDAPLLVAITPAKRDPSETSTSRDSVRRAMRTLLEKQSMAHLYRCTLACAKNCPLPKPDGQFEADRECNLAKSALERPACRSAIARLALSIVESPSTADRLWGDVRRVIQPISPPSPEGTRVYRCMAVRAASWLASRRGSQNGWSYRDTNRFEEALRRVLLALPPVREGDKDQALRDFRVCAFDLHAGPYPPFPACDAICSNQVCLYRFAAADIANSPTFEPRIATILASGDRNVADIWAESQSAAWQLIALDDEAGDQERDEAEAASRRAGLCFAQQAIADAPTVHPRDAELLMTGLLETVQVSSEHTGADNDAHDPNGAE